MKYIRLKCGQSAIIDDEDVFRVTLYKWCLSGNGHVMRYHENFGIYLHHFLVGQPLRPNLTDHINRNPLDNRKENLRIADKSLNSINRDVRKDNTSGITGVYWDKNRKMWTARGHKLGKTTYLGRFKYKRDAIAARMGYQNNESVHGNSPTLVAGI